MTRRNWVADDLPVESGIVPVVVSHRCVIGCRVVGCTSGRFVCVRIAGVRPRGGVCDGLSSRQVYTARKVCTAADSAGIEGFDTAKWIRTVATITTAMCVLWHT